MAATAEELFPARSTKTVADVGQAPASVLLFVSNTDNPATQQRALDALNRHSCVARAQFAPNATRQIRVDYWAAYTNVWEVINTARFHSGVELREIG